MKNRAVTSQQKEEIITQLLKLWVDSKWLRLGQLISNVIQDETKLYYIEDYDLIQELTKSYAKGVQDGTS